MKKHFEQAIAFDRDSPLNQRVGLGKKYNELVDEYNALEAKILGGEEIADVADEEPVDDEQENVVADGAITDEEPATDPTDVTEDQIRNRG